jgi:hypothetical protein
MPQTVLMMIPMIPKKPLNTEHLPNALSVVCPPMQRSRSTPRSRPRAYIRGQISSDDPNDCWSPLASSQTEFFYSWGRFLRFTFTLSATLIVIAANHRSSCERMPICDWLILDKKIGDRLEYLSVNVNLRNRAQVII